MQLPDSLGELAAMLLAINPAELKGVVLRGSRGTCERWVEQFHGLTPLSPLRRLSPNIPEERLLGGLDFAATISRGHAVYERGVLALANGGCVVMPAATMQRGTWQHIARALDQGGVAIERDGFSERHDTVFAAVAIEESADEACGIAFASRVAFWIELDAGQKMTPLLISETEVAAARARLSAVHCNDRYFAALVEGADLMGVDGVRAVILATATARTVAALRSRNDVNDDDIAVAAKLVFAPRATVFDHAPQDSANDVANDNSRNDGSDDSHSDAPPPGEATLTSEQTREDATDTTTDTASETRELADMVVIATRSALPAGLLLSAAARIAGKAGSAGRAGEDRTTGNRGRQIGTRKGDPRGGARLDIVATLRAAVPWQRLRRSAQKTARTGLVHLARDDFRVKRCVSPGTTTTLFVVDASGSSALHRLNEVKGAVELMLAEGYARRDRVALIAFRGTTAQLLLPPTHALARARRAIAGMPAGGGTPMATALDLTARVVQTLKRESGQTVVVILSDGQANVARDGAGGRAKADSDAMDAATRLRVEHNHIVWIDSSARANPQSKRLADAMNARYIALPMASATGLSSVAKMAVA